MLSNKSVRRLIRGCYTKYIRYISLHNHHLCLYTSFPLLKDSSLTCFGGQRRNLCLSTKSSLTTNVSLGKQVIEDRCFDSSGVHSATSAPLATTLYGICDSRDEKEDVKKQKNKQEELTSVEEGDILDLRKILFTRNRDYLIKNNGNQVKAEQLAGKVIVIYFLLLPLDDDSDFLEWRDTETLKDVYNYLPPNKGFEIVFVAVDDVDSSFEEEKLFDPSPETDLENHFIDVFACMPWTAIPFSDITSRKYLQRRFGFKNCFESVRTFVIDPKGVVLHRQANGCFEEYGALGYPFSQEWLTFLDSECKAIATQPTLKNLLCSSERDFVISNYGDMVPIHTLEDKVVALYFYPDITTETDRLTEELKIAYKELENKEEKFEVVLLYLSDTNYNFGFRNEESFWKTFKTMPWLALPYKDPNLKKLKKIYRYPEYYKPGEKEVSMLVIIGPRGEFCEPCGAEILLNYKLPGYPFTREKALKLETERIKDLKLEMIWEPNTIFSRKDGTQVSLSQLAGKRILLLFGILRSEFLNLLKERYLYMKGTDGEFEVIHIYTSDDLEVVDPDQAWFAYPLQKDFWNASDILPCEFDKRYLKRGVFFDVGESTRFLAFDHDGMVVRDTAFPTIDDMNFPFCTIGLEKENLLQLDSVFDWYYGNNSSSCQAGYVGPNQSCIRPVSIMSTTICWLCLWDEDTESYKVRLILDADEGSTRLL